ncbi:MAG: RpiB/LacA/LacB family sugar-phosphate isomerase [Bacilli bacterium]|nr:RpiB/LacA/LacB family sugar-phosphate isomerase [Bacilli bacterium]
MKDFEKTENINIEDIQIGNNTSAVEKLNIEEKPKVFDTSLKEKNTVDNQPSSRASLEDIVKNDFQEKTMVNYNIPNLKTIGIASDHRGFRMKQKLTKYLSKKGYSVIDYGTDSTSSTDYPVFGFKLGEAIRDHQVIKGIAICGSGIGISMACNKVEGVRCAKVNNVSEVKWTVYDNDANVIALSSKMPMFRVKDIVDVFLKTNFSNLERHKKRIDMLNKYKG